MLLLCWGGCKDDPVQNPGTVVGPAGGTVIGPSGATLTIPAGALDKEETFTITADANIPGPLEARPIGFPRAVEPSGVHFKKPAVLVVPYTAAQLGTYKEQDLVIYTTVRSPWAWEAVPTQVGGGKATGQIKHLSHLALTVKAKGQWRKAKGEPCKKISECDWGLTCVNNKCYVCESNGRPCAKPKECCSFNCINQTCYYRALTGQACSAPDKDEEETNPCSDETDACIDGKCWPCLRLDKKCKNTWECCTPMLCVDGRCGGCRLHSEPCSDKAPCCPFAKCHNNKW